MKYLDSRLRATIVFSPASGSINTQAALPETIALLNRHGRKIGTHTTLHTGDIDRITSNAKLQGWDALVVTLCDASLN